MPLLLRAPLLLAFALNPMWVFYAGNGMSEALYSAFLAFSLYASSPGTRRPSRAT